MPQVLDSGYQGQLLLLPGLLQEELGECAKSSIWREDNLLNDPGRAHTRTCTAQAQVRTIRQIPPPNIVADHDAETNFYNPFPNFSFTGPLRPVYPLSPRRKVPKSIPHPDYAEDGLPKYGRVRSNKIEQLDAKAQEGMRKVCRLAREVLDVAAAAVRPGITTDEIDEIVHNACIERNVSITP